MNILVRRPLLVTLLTLAAGGAPFALPSVAQAQSSEDIASAKAAIKDARALRARGDLAGALPKFRAAFALVPTPLTGLDLGETLVALGQLVEAREILVGVTRMPNAATENEIHKKSRADAQALSEDLDKRIPTLSIVLVGAADTRGASVKIDGQRLSSDALLVPRKLNPGHHRISALLPGAPERTREIDLKEGVASTLQLDLSAASPSETPPPPRLAEVPVAPPQVVPPPPQRVVEQRPEPARVETPIATQSSPGSGRRTVAYVVGAGGLVGIALGSYFGISALSKRSTAQSQCGSGCATTSPAYGTLGDALSQADISTAGFVAGGVLLAAAGVLFFTAPHAKNIALTPVVLTGGGGASVGGEF